MLTLALYLYQLRLSRHLLQVFHHVQFLAINKNIRQTKDSTLLVLIVGISAVGSLCLCSLLWSSAHIGIGNDGSSVVVIGTNGASNSHVAVSCSLSNCSVAVATSSCVWSHGATIVIHSRSHGAAVVIHSRSHRAAIVIHSRSHGATVVIHSWSHGATIVIHICRWSYGRIIVSTIVRSRANSAIVRDYS